MTETAENVDIDVPSLKYLGFLPTYGAMGVEKASSLYSYAKENSGPLKDGVATIENKILEFSTPLVEKYEVANTSKSVLEQADTKVDQALSYALTVVDNKFPTTKSMVSSAWSLAAAALSTKATSENLEHYHEVRKEYLLKVQNALEVLKTKLAETKTTAADAAIAAADKLKSMVSEAYEYASSITFDQLCEDICHAWDAFLEMEPVQKLIAEVSPRVTAALTAAESAATFVRKDSRYSYLHGKAKDVIDAVCANSQYQKFLEPALKPYVEKVSASKFYEPAISMIAPMETVN